jgi:2-polyprenyl-6-methoxyphenol hydroxylase-like FAD-dependent oxidoreductase
VWVAGGSAGGDDGGNVNTAIEDAVSLGWKLAAALNGGVALGAFWSDGRRRGDRLRSGAARNLLIILLGGGMASFGVKIY